MFEQLGLIGCGLMGGSFALALKKARLVKRVVGYSKSPSTTEKARSMGVIDVEAPSALLAVSGADIVLVAVPVAATEATFKAMKHLITNQTLVMDVGSTKRDVVEAARRTMGPQLGTFVPAHPIAGKEQAGVEHADANLYQGKQVILTPIERTLTVHLQRAEQLWRISRSTLTAVRTLVRCPARTRHPLHPGARREAHPHERPPTRCTQLPVGWWGGARAPSLLANARVWARRQLSECAVLITTDRCACPNAWRAQ